MTAATFPDPQPIPMAHTSVDTSLPFDPSAEAIIGISFDGVLRAEEFLLALRRLASLGQLTVSDAAVVVKADDDRVIVRETLDPQPVNSALSGAVWAGLVGLLLGGPVGWLGGMAVGAGAGAVAAKIVDLGIPDEWIDWFKAAVRPNTATIVALVSHVDLDGLLQEARRFAGAELVHATLQPVAAVRLSEALSQPSVATTETG